MLSGTTFVLEDHVFSCRVVHTNYLEGSLVRVKDGESVYPSLYQNFVLDRAVKIQTRTALSCTDIGKTVRITKRLENRSLIQVDALFREVLRGAANLSYCAGTIESVVSRVPPAEFGVVRLDNGQTFDNPVGIEFGTPRTAMFDPQSCRPGSFRHRTLAQSLGECKQGTNGHYCDWQNCNQPTHPNGSCNGCSCKWKRGLESPKPCKAGTWLAEEGADDESNCKLLWIARTVNKRIAIL